MFSTAAALVLSALVPLAARAQGDLSAANNVTSLEGTWTSNPSVMTGGDFCIPSQMRFTYPNNTGIAYSFTDTGFFEEAQYRYNYNGANPTCITAYILWQHGTYSLNNNGSITLYPFGSDGRIQVQDPCAAQTNVITYYNQQTLYADWGIVIDIQSGNYVLNLNRFDGAKMPPMYLAALPPNMLPTQVLTGVNASGQSLTKRDSYSFNLFKRGAASARTSIGRETILGAGILALAGLGMSML